MIPKKIHYIWLGNQPLSESLISYIKTWNKLKNYEILRWDETNLELDGLPHAIFEAYRLKKYAFVTDYLRLKILYQYGGIYLDTDMEVFRDFSKLLDTGILLGMIFNASVGTALIGAEKGYPFLKDVLQLYEDCNYTFDEDKDEFILHFKQFENVKIVNNNDLLTGYFIKNVPGFRLNNQKRKFAYGGGGAENHNMPERIF